MTLTSRILLILAAALVPAFAMEAYNAAELRRDRERQVAQNALHQAELLHADVASIITSAGQVMGVVSALPSVRSLDRACRQDLLWVRSQFERYKDISVFDAAGAAVCSALSLPLDQVRPAARIHAEALSKGGLAVGSHTMDPISGEHYLHLAYPIRAVEGDPIGSVQISLRLDWIGEHLARLNRPANSTIVIGDRAGTIIGRFPDHARYLGQPFLSPIKDLLTEAKEPGNAVVPGFDGKDRLIGYVPPAASPVNLWTSVGFYTPDLMADLEAATLRGLLFLLAAAALAVTLVVSFNARVIRRPTRALLKAVRLWTAGDLSARAKIKGGQSELTDIARAFNTMADTLQRDMERRERAEAQQRLLMDELNHRVKNTLATVQAVASQTLRHAADPADFRRSFEARLLSLSKTHDLLTRSQWGPVSVRALFWNELCPFARGDASRASLKGPEVDIPADQAVSLALVAHELATNAVKYGALSVPGGQVSVEWHVVENVLAIAWTERGGPAVEAPRNGGFGSKLIDRTVRGTLNGTAILDYAPAGLRCQLRIPLRPSRDQSPVAVAAE